jgi:hypothetical protein
MVDLPDAERPVSQMVRPLCLSSPARMAGVSGLAWKWMFLQFQDEVSNEEVVLCNHDKQNRAEWRGAVIAGVNHSLGLAT